MRARGAAPIAPVQTADESTALDPDEQIEDGVSRIHADVADQLLTRTQAQEPEFFERAVLDLLMAMGHGGAEGSATRTQLSRDGGIDGIIDQDALGLSRIYVQAERYPNDNTAGRPAIQEFVGALADNAANQGVFLTTSHFSADAQEVRGPGASAGRPGRRGETCPADDPLWSGCAGASHCAGHRRGRGLLRVGGSEAATPTKRTTQEPGWLSRRVRAGSR